jgi:hypothetical protein
LTAWALPAQAFHAVFTAPHMAPAKVTAFIEWLQAQLDHDWWTSRH